MKATHTMDTQVSLQIGIDWADQKHDFCLCPSPQNSAIDSIAHSQESGVIASCAKHLHEWIEQLRKRFSSGDFEVCLELSKGQLINVLSNYDFIRIYPLNPISADSFRQSPYPSLRKDDATDAALLLEILQKHREHLRQQIIAPASARLLEGLVQARRKSVDQRTAQGARVPPRVSHQDRHCSRASKQSGAKCSAFFLGRGW